MVGREIKSFYVASKLDENAGFFQGSQRDFQPLSRPTVSFDAGGERFSDLPDSSAQDARKSPSPLSVLTGLRPAKSVWAARRFASANSRRCHCARHLPRAGKPSRRRLGPAMTVRENITLPSLKSFAPFNFIRRERERKVANEQIKSFKIKNAGLRNLRAELERRQPAESCPRQMAFDVAEGDDS